MSFGLRYAVSPRRLRQIEGQGCRSKLVAATFSDHSYMSWVPHELHLDAVADEGHCRQSSILPPTRVTAHEPRRRPSKSRCTFNYQAVIARAR